MEAKQFEMYNDEYIYSNVTVKKMNTTAMTTFDLKLLPFRRIKT